MLPSDYYTTGWASITKPSSIAALNFTKEQVEGWLNTFTTIFDGNHLMNTAMAELQNVKFNNGDLTQSEQARFALTLLAFCRSEYTGAAFAQPDALTVMSPKIKVISHKHAKHFGLRPQSIYCLLGVMKTLEGYQLIVRANGKPIVITNSQRHIMNGNIELTITGGSKLHTKNDVISFANGIYVTPEQAREYILWAVDAGLYKPNDDIVRLCPSLLHPPKVKSVGILPSRPANKVDVMRILAKARNEVDKVTEEGIIMETQTEESNIKHRDIMAERTNAVNRVRRELTNLLDAHKKFKEMHPMLSNSMNVIGDDLKERMKAAEELQKFLDYGLIPSSITLNRKTENENN